jgi:hypothetical protein
MRASPPFRAGFWLGVQVGAVVALFVVVVLMMYVKVIL